MRILNLGCGTKVSSSPDVLNIDWSIYLRLKRSRILSALTPFFVRGDRLDHFRALPRNILVHNLARPLPIADESVDVVYHSHVLEHLDRDTAKTFLLEVKRVLRPGGIQRIVVPDMERVCRAYLSHLSLAEMDTAEAQQHDSYIAAIIEQSVRKEAYGTSRQKPVARFFENVLLGDARQRGETHQWMYDRVSLSVLLRSLGYRSPQVQAYDRSLVPKWHTYRLDLDDQGHEYKPGSLYMEATN
jgi:SAM-dependent methyltransferase